jgi:four helix bundle protein
MVYVKSFRNLEVYKLSREVTREVFELSKNFPKEELYSLTDQIRRSSRSFGVQIAESWGKRRYEMHFISKLTDADSELFETQHWLEIAMECQYLDPDTGNRLLKMCESTGKMIQKMIDKSHSFCNKQN